MKINRGPPQKASANLRSVPSNDAATNTVNSPKDVRVSPPVTVNCAIYAAINHGSRRKAVATPIATDPRNTEKTLPPTPAQPAFARGVADAPLVVSSRIKGLNPGTARTVGLTEKKLASRGRLGAAVMGSAVEGVGASAPAHNRSTMKAPRRSLEWYPKVSPSPMAHRRMADDEAPVSSACFPAMRGMVGRVKDKEVAPPDRSTTAPVIS